MKRGRARTMASGRWLGVFRHVRELLQPASTRSLPDGELLDRFVSTRDQDAFALLLQRHGPKVMGVCRHLLRDTHRADDAFQATFLVFIRKAGSIGKRQSVGSWLYGVAFRTALKARARAHRIQVHEQQVENMPTPKFQGRSIEPDVRPTLLEEVHRLPEKYRVPVLLCYFDGKSEQEAAAELCWPAGTVRVRMARARELLRSRLARRGLALSAVQLVALFADNSLTAAVPVPLANSTIEAASLFAAGQAVIPGVISAEVAALTEGVLKSMFLNKIKLAGAVLLSLSLLAVTGGSLLMQRALAGRPVQAAVKPEEVASEQAQQSQDPKEPQAIAVIKSFDLEKSSLTLIFKKGSTEQTFTLAKDVKVTLADGAATKLGILSLGGVVHKLSLAPKDKTVITEITVQPKKP